MIDDVILNKIEIIKKCIRRVKEEYDCNPKNLENYTKQDSVTLNIQRACEAVIDLGMHVIAEKGLGIPQTSGFRNIAIHNYQKLNLKIIQAIIEKDLKDLLYFTDVILKI